MNRRLHTRAEVISRILLASIHLSAIMKKMTLLHPEVLIVLISYMYPIAITALDPIFDFNDAVPAKYRIRAAYLMISVVSLMTVLDISLHTKIMYTSVGFMSSVNFTLIVIDFRNIYKVYQRFLEPKYEDIEIEEYIVHMTLVDYFPIRNKEFR